MSKRRQKNLGRDSYNLHYLAGKSWREVAQELDSTWNAVRKAAYRYADRENLPLPAKKDGTDVWPGVSVRSDGNTKTFTSYGPMITTPDQLIEFCKIDLDEWIITRREATAWTTPSKDVEKDLTIKDGVYSGTIRQTNDMRFAQNIRVFVAAVPRHPEKVLPAISPVCVKTTRRPVSRKRQKKEFVRHLVWSDPQFGFRRRVRDAQLFEFHNRNVLDVILQIATVADIDRMDILGDWFDSSEFTDKFIRSPEFYYTFQPAIEESFWWLLQYIAICDDTRLHEGNHDKRVPDSIKKHLPFAYGLRVAGCEIDAPAVLSIRNLLSLDDLGVEWVDDYPNDRDFITPGLVFNHGSKARGAPLETARAVARGHISEIFGHIHRREHSVGVRPDPIRDFEVEGWSFGCACWTDHRVPGHSVSQEWTNGLGIIDVYPNGYFDVNPIGVYDGVAAWNGRLFHARDRLDDLRKAVPTWRW